MENFVAWYLTQKLFLKIMTKRSNLITQWIQQGRAPSLRDELTGRPSIQVWITNASCKMESSLRASQTPDLGYYGRCRQGPHSCLTGEEKGCTAIRSVQVLRQHAHRHHDTRYSNQ
jgi:hypothetical protein